MSRELSGIATIALRDFIKFLRDRMRILFSLVFPFVFIGVLGGSLQANLGPEIGYNFLMFTFTGVLGSTLFQSTASGIISLISDRESDFSQEIFVSPISRYSIILGKILGESLVALAQGIGIFGFGLIMGIPITFQQVLAVMPALIAACLLGGAFGVMVLANLSNQRAANQIFPLVIFPQFFLSGAFSPIRELPIYLFALSRISPMTYVVDLIRNFYYFGSPEYDKVVLHTPLYNLTIIVAFFVVFLIIGTYLFVRNERNK